MNCEGFGDEKLETVFAFCLPEYVQVLHVVNSTRLCLRLPYFSAF